MGKLGVSGSGNPPIPAPRPQVEDQSTSVRAGERNLSDVARRIGVSVDSIEQANPKLPNAGRLTAGQEIKLPKGNPSKQTASQGHATGIPSTESGAGARVADNQLQGQLNRAQITKQAGKVAGKASGKVKPSSVVGQQVAILATGKSDPVVVTKEFGPPNGFGTRYEALALARGANNKSTAIFQDGNNRWHAVQTNVPLGRDGNPTWSPEPTAGHLEFVDQPDLQKWTTAGQTVEQLKKQGLTISDYALQVAYRDQIAVALGIPPSEINIVGANDAPDPSKLNFNPFLQSYGNAGVAKLDGKPAAIQIGRGELVFDNPFEVISTTFHEATHVRHHARGNELLKQWEDTGKGTKFGEWLKEKFRAGKISLEDLVTVWSEYRGGKAPTEAISHLNGFMATFATDRTDNRLIESNLGMAADYSPTSLDLPQELNNRFEKELMGRLESFYGGLDASDRSRFDAAMAKVKKEHPNSWLAKFQHP